MGNIDLNSIVFNANLNKEEILKHLTQEEIYKYYTGNKIEIPCTFCSPLRDDNVPSFGLYYHRDGSGTIMWYDHGLGESGDCFMLVSKMYNLGYTDALYKVLLDFGLSNINVSAKKVKSFSKIKKVIQRNPLRIGIKTRKWNKVDATYWSSYGISKKTLIKYNVIPIEYMFYNGNPIKVHKVSYAYQELKDDKVTYKIYQPFSKEFKWVNNTNYTVHQGYRQLPDKGELLVITKSLKDVMSLLDVIGITAVAIQSESVMMKDSVMNEYKRRFTKVICLFDNDNAGKRLSRKYSNKYNVPHFFMPEMENVTDFSDLVKAVGIEESRKIFNTCIENEIK
jgi:5S rRNA maturation endonuclease (ribonuclease M5)